MKKFFILITAVFVVCWARPDASHIITHNNDYLPPLQGKLNSYEASTYQQAHTETPFKSRHAQIESIQPSIHIASFSVRTTVPLSQGYSQPQPQQSHAYQTPNQQSYYAPAALQASSESYNNYNAPVTYQQSTMQQQQYNAPQIYSPRQAYTEPEPSISQSYTSSSPTIPQYNAAPATYEQAHTPPVESNQHSYVPPAQAPELNNPAYTTQETKQSYVPPAPVQQTYRAPELNSPTYTTQETKQSYVPPAPVQQTYQAPELNRPAYTTQETKQSYVPPAPVQQTYQAPELNTVQQIYTPSSPAQQTQSLNYQASAQQAYLPPAPVQQTQSQAPVQQSYDNTAPERSNYRQRTTIQQTYSPPARGQQSYISAAPIQHSFVPPVEQTYVPPVTVNNAERQNYLTPAAKQLSQPAPVQQSYVPPAPADQPYVPPESQMSAQQTNLPPATEQLSQPAPIQQSYVPPRSIARPTVTNSHAPAPPMQQNYNGPTFTSSTYLQPAPGQQLQSFQTSPQQAYSSSAATQQVTVQSQQSYNEQSYSSPPAPSFTQQVHSPSATVQQTYRQTPAPPQQTYLPPTAVAQSPEQPKKSYSLTPAAIEAPEQSQQFQSTPNNVQHFVFSERKEPQIKQATTTQQQTSPRESSEGPYNYSPIIQSQFVPHPTQEVRTVPAPTTAPVSHTQTPHVVEPTSGSYNYREAPSSVQQSYDASVQHSEPQRPVAIDGFYNYKPSSRIEPTAMSIVPAQLTYSYEESSVESGVKSPISNIPQPQPTPAQSTQNYSPSHHYSSQISQQNQNTAQPTERQAIQSPSSTDGSYNYKPTVNTAPASQSYNSPTPVETFNFIPKSLLQPKSEYNYHSQSAHQAPQSNAEETVVQHGGASLAERPRETTRLVAVQSIQKTDTPQESKAAQSDASIGTEYAANGGYIYRRN